ncbi:hypothetical protein VNO80_24062 [Phaseolus coccineus]|uniref:Uncharacterized protein n=1 Tax=Phaseolus coccineus TaxID=3886 RepID=A0AAN9LWL7_PHACN
MTNRNFAIGWDPLDTTTHGSRDLNLLSLSPSAASCICNVTQQQSCVPESFIHWLLHFVHEEETKPLAKLFEQC